MAMYGKKLFALLFVSTLSYNASAIDLTGSVSSSKSNLGYSTTTSQTVSGNIAFYLTDFMRIGFTHSQEISINNGYSVGSNVDESTITEEYYYKNTTQMDSNAADLTFILYNGAVFAPYIFGGAVIKDYKFRLEKTATVEKGSVRLGPVPNAGLGMSIRLNRDFSLKLSYTVSPGIKKMPGEEAQGVLDTSTTVGLTYHM